MSENWSPEKIKYELSERGYNLTRVANDAGISYQSVSNAMRVRSPCADHAISEILKIPASEIWPSRYAEGEVPGKNEAVVEVSDEMKKRLAAFDADDESLPERRRSWSKTKIEQSLHDAGFTDVRALEMHACIPLGSIGQAATRCSVQVDAVISKAVGVPVWDIFPHRYWIGGQRVPEYLNLEKMSDERFDHFRNSMGDVMVEKFRQGRRVDEEQRVIVEIDGGRIYEDVSPYANLRAEKRGATLPPGMKLDGK